MVRKVESKLRKHILRVTVFLVLVACHFAISCTEPHEHTARAVNPEDSASIMVSYGVNTLISDSGVIKYRIVTERWEVNTVRQPSRWEFMKGVFFEQFDEQFHVQGYIQADTAWYYDQQRLWKLRGRVNMRNVNGLVFNSEELYWDGIHHEFYSTVYSRVVTPERTMEGSYFRSDEKMDHYLITNSKGSFIAADLDPEPADLPPDTATVPAVSPSGASPAATIPAASPAGATSAVPAASPAGDIADSTSTDKQ